jgi:predicted Rossmann fold flavoprotein
LVPLTFSKNLLEKTKELAGISAFCEVSIGKKVFLENVLFTHKGISGPAILQISSYWHKNQTITINFSPKIDIYDYLIDAKQQNLKQDVANSLSNLLPKKLINYILLESKISGILANLSKRQIQIISNNINSYQIIPDGTEGFVKAEVTIGGVDSNEISSKTFESKKIKNLYFIGEVLDVTGHLGGYNFQWAWSSGFVAGNYA